jgi:RimJ/RimL family protein N-acetyltransferase
MEIPAAMMNPRPTIRRIKFGEAALYRSIRLEALMDSPEAFSTSYESALARAPDSWIIQADATAEGKDRATFIAFQDRPIGLAALYRDGDYSTTGELIQMWVAPEYRGGSLAADLLDHLFQWAAEHDFQLIRAQVTEGNPRALRFYLKYGFELSHPQENNTTLLKSV